MCSGLYITEKTISETTGRTFIKYCTRKHMELLFCDSVSMLCRLAGYSTFKQAFTIPSVFVCCLEDNKAINIARWRDHMHVQGATFRNGMMELQQTVTPQEIQCQWKMEAHLITCMNYGLQAFVIEASQIITLLKLSQVGRWWRNME